MTKDAPVKTVSKDCLKKAVDAEVAKITNEKQCTFNNPGLAGDVLNVT
jgi:hypothetical protein